jgi:hypothetical protein
MAPPCVFGAFMAFSRMTAALDNEGGGCFSGGQTGIGNADRDGVSRRDLVLDQDCGLVAAVGDLESLPV